MENAVFTPVLNALAAMPIAEMVAVVLAIAYLVLAARGHIACWLCAAISTVIYIVLFWRVSLLMESALNVYYLAMAGYGWWQWRHGGNGTGLPISTWPWRRHVLVVAIVVSVAAVSGLTLSNHTAAAWPYLDSFTTWGAVVTTWMVTRKILENWIYWFVLDAVSIPLYLDRGLHLTALLFGVYLVIVVFGFFAWRREYRDGPTAG